MSAFFVSTNSTFAQGKMHPNFLSIKFSTGIELTPGSEEEIEIRGCSIDVVERVVEFVRTEIQKCPNMNLDPSVCNAIRLDHFLWDFRRQHAEQLEIFPFHKVRTIYY